MAKNEMMVSSQNTDIVSTGEMNFNMPEGYICTIDTSTEEGKITVVNALNAAEPLKDYMDTVIKVVDIVTTIGQRSISKDDCTNTYLICDDGKILFSQSDGVARAVRVITAAFNGNFGDGVSVICREKKLNNGNTLKTLELVAK